MEQGSNIGWAMEGQPEIWGAVLVWEIRVGVGEVVVVLSWELHP